MEVQQLQEVPQKLHKNLSTNIEKIAAHIQPPQKLPKSNKICKKSLDGISLTRRDSLKIFWKTSKEEAHQVLEIQHQILESVSGNLVGPF